MTRVLVRMAVGTGLAAAGLAAGCARVDPKTDYARAAQVVSEQTGSSDVYDPLAEDAAGRKLDELLAHPLTVDDAVRVALLNNAGFQAEFAVLGAARADLVQSTLFTNPSISFGIEWPDAGGRSRLTGSLAQQIADLWQIPVRKKIAEADLERTLLTTARHGVELVADVQVAAYRLLALEQVASKLQEGRALAARAAGVAEAQLKAGEVGQLDVSLSRAALLDVDLELLGLEREREAAMLELGRLMGLSRGPRSWTLADRLPEPRADLPDEAELIASALLQRLDARAALLQVTAAERELVRQYLRIVPDFTLSADFERVEERTLPGRKLLADTVRSSLAAGHLTPPSIQSRGERRIDQAQVINSVLGPSITVTLPIWDQNQAQIAKAGFVVTQRRKELEDLFDSIAAQVQQAIAAARRLRELARVYEQQALPQAEETVATALRLYESGEQAILLLLDAQESLLRRQRNYIEALRDYSIAVVNLERATAGRLPTGPTPSSAPAAAAENRP